MTVVQKLDKYYEGLAEDPKPTGVRPDSYFRETDTYLLWWTSDGDNWVLASNVMYNLAVLQHHLHSRMRVYPQDVQLTAALVAATADVFGDWAEIIPIDTVDFIYKVVGLVIESATAAGTYFIQIGFSTVAITEPTEAQRLGERRLYLPTPIGKSPELLDFYSMECPANAKLWGRVKSKAGGSETLEVSVGLVRHLEITNPMVHLTTWPWST